MRPPEAFVRPLADGEATALKNRAKKANHFATRERAAILPENRRLREHNAELHNEFALACGNQRRSGDAG